MADCGEFKPYQHSNMGDNCILERFHLEDHKSHRGYTWPYSPREKSMVTEIHALRQASGGGEDKSAMNIKTALDYFHGVLETFMVPPAESPVFNISVDCAVPYEESTMKRNLGHPGIYVRLSDGSQWHLTLLEGA